MVTPIVIGDMLEFTLFRLRSQETGRSVPEYFDVYVVYKSSAKRKSCAYETRIHVFSYNEVFFFSRDLCFGAKYSIIYMFFPPLIQT